MEMKNNKEEIKLLKTKLQAWEAYGDASVEQEPQEETVENDRRQLHQTHTHGNTGNTGGMSGGMGGGGFGGGISGGFTQTTSVTF